MTVVHDTYPNAEKHQEGCLNVLRANEVMNNEVSKQEVGFS